MSNCNHKWVGSTCCECGINWAVWITADHAELKAALAKVKAGQPSAHGEAHKGSEPPPRKEGWNHSNRVLVWYAPNEHSSDTFSIAYYHYDPPFKNAPEWTDFDNGSCGEPAFWWPLPEIPAEA